MSHMTIEELMREMGIDPNGPEMRAAEARYEGATQSLCAYGNCTETRAAGTEELLHSVGPVGCPCDVDET